MSKRIRCAIYTRKSTEDGLEQDFNSLDAQREACEAYIMSQKGLGWVTVKKHYDDGGLSGGTLERPALKDLLQDVEARKIDLVVVYKVDRLTRSLTDFVKIVEQFDAQEISFVSVTQQFNTSTSMGRLTLNVLLSFAQFEREVTGERIRDKIAASKKKGMWMGGLVPLGYDLKDKKLVVNAEEAETVQILFDLYLKIGSVNAVVREAKALNLVTKVRQKGNRETGGKPFSRGHLYQLLSNPLYFGDVTHKGVRYAGQHDAIVTASIFEAVQQKLSANAASRHSQKNSTSPSLLTGLLYDETGDRLCPSHAVKKDRTYRYYISKRLIHGTSEAKDGWRIPAKAIEGSVLDALSHLLNDPQRLIENLGLSNLNASELQEMINAASGLSLDLKDRETLTRLLKRVTLNPHSIDLEISKSAMRQLIRKADDKKSESVSDTLTLSVPIELRKRGVETKIIMAPRTGESTRTDQNLIHLIAQAHGWWDQLKSGSASSVEAISEHTGICASEITRALPLAFLAPSIVEAILAGRQQTDLTLERLKRFKSLPTNWDDQHRVLGFPHQAQG